MLNKILSLFNSSSSEDFLEERAISKLQNLKLTHREYEVSIRKQPISQIKDYFSGEDNRKQFIPDGEPFQGEFDFYFDIRKENEFYGFYRISLLPENKLEIHCGCTHFDSFLARRYLQVTEVVLKEIQEIFPKYAITSECLTTHEKANNYLRYFCFEQEDSKDEVNSYMLNKSGFGQKFG